MLVWYTGTGMKIYCILTYLAMCLEFFHSITESTLQQELIKRDDQLSYLPHEHFVEDNKKLKMMKKKADQFANEARQTAQKVRLWVTLQAW